MAPRKRTIEERFWSKVDLNGPAGYHYLTGENLGPCWLWTGAPDRDGYGRISVGGKGGKNLQAHRVAYGLLVGPIPDGLELDHLCRVKPCVRHTEAVTSEENTRRGERATKTHCSAGHEFAGDNLYLRPGGGRGCRSCRRVARRRHERKEAA